MTEIDILRAQIIRQDFSQPWGFRLQGGADAGEPLHLTRVTPGSPAARIGLRDGDEVTEIDNTSTVRLTYQQSIDLIDQHNDSLLLTIERKARGSIPVNPVLYSSAEQNQPKPYQPLEMTGSNQPSRTTSQRHYDYQCVESKAFDTAPMRPQQLFSQPQSSSYLPPTNTDFYSARIDSDAPFHQHHHQHPEFQQQQEEQQSPTHPQSRTFKMLQSVMENDEQYAGVAGLPPPRSAALEQMKREGSFQRPPSFPAPLPPSYSSSGSRVKVIMPQKYNSPLAMYSADNVLETFTSQTENMLSNLERKQHYGQEQEALFSSDYR